MYLPEHKFIVEKVGPVEETRNGGHKIQKIILRKPGWRDEFGDQVGKDDYYEVQVWNNQITEIPVLKKGDKVKAMLNLNGKEILDNNNGELFYALNLNLRKIEVL